MSDILIKEAKMPKACEYCMFAGYGGVAMEYYVCMFNGKSKDRYSNGRMESCPLVEIPPHGRLIDADEFEDELYEHEFSNWCDKDEVSELIDNMPTADVVKVVRCKDCKWYGLYDNGFRCVMSFMPKETDFCSYGERKNNE